MGNNKLQVFNNTEFGKIRALEINGEPWFVGKDIAAALGYINTKDALATHVESDDKQIIQRSGNTTLEIPNRGLTIINESGLYSLIMSSKLPGARKFKHWITSEVLPTLRKTGTYSMRDIPSADPSNWHKAAAAANAADRALRIQDQPALKRALQTRIILASAGVPLIPDFIKEDPQLSLFDTAPINVESLALATQPHTATS